MAKTAKHGLGRGLDALLGGVGAPGEPAVEAEATLYSGERLLSLRISDIDPNREQPRKRFEEEALRELAASIASVGVLQPVLVWEKAGRYQLIAGERRWRAARLAGLSEIPAIVRDWDEVKRLEAQLIENLQRSDLNPVEEAEGAKALMEQCGYTQEELSARVGKSRSAVANLLRLLNLPECVLELLKRGDISAGHARALAGLNDPELIVRLANLCVAQGWSVRQLEKIARQPRAEKPEKPPRASEFSALEKMAREAFGTKARIEGDMRRGRLILSYYSQDDLQRIWEVLERVEK